MLFLDEPTTGLDPQSRRQLWDLIEGFRARGGTILLTTHYMDEAERLCDRVAIMDHGKIIALGTPRELIASLGAEHVIEFSVDGDARPRSASPALPGVSGTRRDGVGLRPERARGARVDPGAARGASSASAFRSRRSPRITPRSRTCS